MINCTLFAKNLYTLDSAFTAGDVPAIVIADAAKLFAAMNATATYYFNQAKTNLHTNHLANDQFELPVVTIRAGKIVWIEGFPQVDAAIAANLPLIPIHSVTSLVPGLLQLVGAPGAAQAQAVAQAQQLYDFTECGGLTIN